MGARVVERTGLRGLFFEAAVILAVCLVGAAFPVFMSADDFVVQKPGGFSGDGTSEVSELSPKTQYDLFRKVLFYERSMDKRAAGDLVVCILYESGSEASLRVREGLEEAIRNDPELGIDSVRFESTAIDLDKIRSLGEALDARKADFLYIAPLEPKTMKARLRDVIRESQGRKVPTITGVLEYVDLGVAIGFGVGQDRPQIRVNLSASRAQGLVFSAQFLRRVGII